MWNHDVSTHTYASSSSKKRRILVAIVAFVTVCGIALGLTLTLTQAKAKADDNDSNSSASESNVDVDYSEFGMKSLSDFEMILSSDIRSISISTRKNNNDGSDNDDGGWGDLNRNAWNEMTSNKLNQLRDGSLFTNSDDNDGDRIAFPFIICVSTEEGDAQLLKDGHGRMRDIISKLFDDIHMMSINSICVDDLSFIFNHATQTCAYFYMPVPSLSLLQGIRNDNARDKISVQPLLPIMKIRESTTSKAQQLVRDERIILEICPNVVQSSGLVSDEEKNLKQLADAIMSALRNSVETAVETVSLSRTNLMNLRSKPRTFEKNVKSCSIKDSIDMLHTLEYEVRLANYGMHHITIDLELAIRHHGVELSSCMDYILSFLSSFSTVCSISISDSISTVNQQAQWISQGGTKTGDTAFFDKGLDGKGQVVGVSDTGLDIDNCYFWDSTGDIVKDGRVDYSRRKVVQYTPYKDTVDEKNGHGTHVVGTLLGRRAADGKTESNGIANGVAQGAKVAFFDLAMEVNGNLQMSVPSNAFEYVGMADSKIHSASWGTQTFINYGVLDQTFDDYLHEESDAIIIIAAGNKGEDGISTVASPAISKNTIVVGASQSSGPDIYDFMLGHEYVAYFSARGPTLDGRIGIDVVAPGSYILSSASDPLVSGECDDSEGTRYDQGTSMAVPVVSGSAAIIRQYFEEGWFPSGIKQSQHKMNASGALIKAVILNGAQSMNGVQDKSGATRPVSDYDQYIGYGRLDLLTSLPLNGKNTFRAIALDRKKISRNEEEIITFHIDKTECDSDYLSATLVWMDPPAANGCTRCLINDLDLYVEKRGENRKYFPNGKTVPDSNNNVERIRLPVVHGDEFTMHVHGKNLASNNQSYALILTGCVTEGFNSPLTLKPTSSPTRQPTYLPTSNPTKASTARPTFTPTTKPVTNFPTSIPTFTPTTKPLTNVPTSRPTFTPTAKPITKAPTPRPTFTPTAKHVTAAPTSTLTSMPTLKFITKVPTSRPTLRPILKSTKFPSLKPTKTHVITPENLPTTKPTLSQTGLNSVLRTSMTGNIKSYGNMFDVVTKDNNIVLFQIDIHVDSSTMEALEIYTRGGTFVNVSRHPAAWKHDASSIVFGKGYGAPTKLTLFNPIVLGAGTTTAFYLTLNTANMIYSAGSGFGNVIADNSNMSILEGAGKAYLFKNTFLNRKWNGAFHYSINNDEMNIGEVNFDETIDSFPPTVSPFNESNEEEIEILLPLQR